MADSLNGHYLARKIHSLFGVLPVGAFLLFHLWENSMARKGAEFYNEHVVKGIENLVNYRLAAELLLAAAILFHGIYGIAIWWQGKTNVYRYRYAANGRYWIQRITAFVTFAFIAWHVWATRIAAALDDQVARDLFSHMQRLYGDPVNVALYGVGIVGASYHLANGLWLFGINWGVTTHPRAQKISAWACALLFFAVTAIGLHALWGFNRRFF